MSRADPASLNLERPSSIQDWNIERGPAPLVGAFSRIAWRDEAFDVLADPERSERFGIAFKEIADFNVDFLTKEIRVGDGTQPSADTLRHLLFDQVVPRILAHQGMLVLHAAAVQVATGILLLIGPSGCGKSTLAASLQRAGFLLLGDDAIVIRNGDDSSAGSAVYRSLRLFPDSIAGVLNGAANLSPVADYTKKQNVEHAELGPAEPSTVVAALILDPSAHEHVGLETMAGSEACMSFIEHSFWLDPGDIRNTKTRIREASALASRVPAFRLRYPRDYSRLPEVHERISAMLKEAHQ